MLAAGLTNDECARLLHLSVDTVKTHLRRAYEATGARDRAHLVAWGYLSGTLTLPTCEREHVPTVAEAAEAHGVPLTHAHADQVPPHR